MDASIRLKEWHPSVKRISSRVPRTGGRSAVDSAQFDVGEVTRLLRATRKGEPAAVERLVPLVYGDLRRLALRQPEHEYDECTSCGPSSRGEATVAL